MEDIKEKSADEMFDELGYKINKEVLNYDKEILISYEANEGFITFYKDGFFTLVAKDRDSVYSVDKEELKAINKKVEELGW